MLEVCGPNEVWPGPFLFSRILRGKMFKLGFNVEQMWVIVFFPFFLTSLMKRSSKEPIEVREGNGEVISGGRKVPFLASL